MLSLVALSDDNVAKHFRIFSNLVSAALMMMAADDDRWPLMTPDGR